MAKYTTESFIEKASLVHDNKYDYSKTEYTGCYSEITIICPEHGEFKQKPGMHLFGNGCKQCYFKKVSERCNKGIDKFIEEASIAHNNKYDYSLAVYKNTHSKLKIICPEHGEFEQIAKDHFKGRGCQKCGNISSGINGRVSLEDFIYRSSIAHNNKYDYSKTKYITSDKKVTIICPIHGKFKQIANDHIKGIGCATCRESKGETRIRFILKKLNINFIQEHTFINCINKKTKKRLPFDFYLPDYNLCIEYDGIQHFKPFSFSNDQTYSLMYNNLKSLRSRDNIKTKYCIKNNIKLLRIPYWEFNNIHTIIAQKLE